MQVKHMQFLTALRQAQKFLDANIAALGTINSTGARRSLDSMVDQIASLSETQDAHRIQVTSERTNELRLAAGLRRKFLKPIVKIARAKLSDVAQLSNIALPPGNSNTAMLVSRALAIAESVQPWAQVFTDAGLAADFLDRLRAAAAEVLASVSGKGEHRTKRIKSTDSITKEVSQARHAVGILDALVRAELGPSDPLVREWRSAVRVIGGGAPQPAAQPVAPVVPTTPGTPAAPAAPAAAGSPLTLVAGDVPAKEAPVARAAA
jgi:hypothetical protein